MTNPYAAPQSEASAVEAGADVNRSARTPHMAGGYLGTVCAGCVFGLIGGPAGVGIGMVAAGVTGLFWFALAPNAKSRISPVVLAGIFGALTGFSSVALLFLTFLPPPPPIDSLSLIGVLGSVAAFAGGIGGICGAAISTVWAKPQNQVQV